ncbi:hypothetical protein SNEBB_008961 [Seison nebaliae]|nr:hypothetical protein SNEBB_008961 [Seison nebaliae]
MDKPADEFTRNIASFSNITKKRKSVSAKSNGSKKINLNASLTTSAPIESSTSMESSQILTSVHTDTFTADNTFNPPIPSVSCTLFNPFIPLIPSIYSTTSTLNRSVFEPPEWSKAFKMWNTITAHESEQRTKSRIVYDKIVGRLNKLRKSMVLVRTGIRKKLPTKPPRRVVPLRTVSASSCG